MVRVLLLLEDYNELLFTETILKKVGFDVESSKNHLNLVEMLLGFNPEVLVVPGNGRRILLADVLHQVRKQRRQPDIFVIGAGDAVQEGMVTKVLTYPLNPKELLSFLAEYGGMDADVLLDKYRRAQAEVTEIVHVQASASMDPDVLKPKETLVSGESQTIKDENKKSEKLLKIQLMPTTITPEERTLRFEKALAQASAAKNITFNTDRIKEEKKAIRMSETKDEHSLKLENERKEFLKILAEVTPTSLKKMS